MDNVSNLSVLCGFGFNYGFLLITFLHSASLLQVLLSQTNVCISQECLFSFIFATSIEGIMLVLLEEVFKECLVKIKIIEDLNIMLLVQVLTRTT